MEKVKKLEKNRGLGSYICMKGLSVIEEGG
jgi:hypothetical protein